MTPGRAAYEEWATAIQALSIGSVNSHEVALTVLQAIAPRWDFVSDEVKAIWERIAFAAISSPVTAVAKVPCPCGLDHPGSDARLLTDLGGFGPQKNTDGNAPVETCGYHPGGCPTVDSQAIRPASDV